MVKMMSVTASDCKYVLFLILIYLVSSYIICNDSRDSIFLKEETHSPFTQARSLIVYYGHSLPSADSRRAVVSYWRQNVH